MAVFLDTRGNPTLGIGICDRCKIKMPLAELFSDPNFPGLKCCRKDLDDFDPYRLPARQPETITLPFVRPDYPVDIGANDTPVTKDGDDFIVFNGDKL